MTSCALLTLALTQTPETQDQVDRLVKLIRSTQERSADLKKRLDDRQQHLAKLYAEYDLDSKAVAKTQAEILDLQKQLLDNYHRLHVELRQIVGAERFATLRQRVDRLLGMNPEKK
jgi:predicted  nucleic acid-binding Zn-ribbon protein